MSAMTRWLAGALLLVGCFNPFPTAPGERQPAPGSNTNWSEGQKLFDVACSRCHGGDGRGLTGSGVSLWDLKLTDQEVLARVRSGKPPHMPSKGGYPVLTEPQLEEILRHLRTLRR